MSFMDGNVSEGWANLFSHFKEHYATFTTLTEMEARVLPDQIQAWLDAQYEEDELNARKQNLSSRP